MKSHHGSYYYYTGETDKKKKNGKKETGEFTGKEVEDKIDELETESLEGDGQDEGENSETEKS